MNLQFASDLHLEFPDNKEFLGARPLKPEGDILLLAGDIVPLSQLHQHSDFFNYLSDHFGFTYWLPGNHEYYHSDISERSGLLNEKIKENVLLVNNTSVRAGDLNLIFSTLWTRISPRNQFEIQLRLSDFHVIKYGGRLLGVEQYNLMHDRCRSFLKEELDRKRPGQTIVITHHMPTFRNYPEEYRGDALNEAFAVELSDLIEATGPDYWIFGHHHANKGGFKIGKTHLTTNQLGYVMYNEQEGFNKGKIIEI
jgi:predicted phosphohydrolase